MYPPNYFVVTPLYKTGSDVVYQRTLTKLKAEVFNLDLVVLNLFKKLAQIELSWYNRLIWKKTIFG